MSDVKTRQVSSVKSARDLVSLLNKTSGDIMVVSARVTRLETYVGQERRSELPVVGTDEMDAFAGSTIYGGEERRKSEIEKPLYEGNVFITKRGPTGRFHIGAEFDKLSVDPLGAWKVHGKNGSSYAAIVSKQGNLRVYVNE